MIFKVPFDPNPSVILWFFPFPSRGQAEVRGQVLPGGAEAVPDLQRQAVSPRQALLPPGPVQPVQPHALQRETLQVDAGAQQQ